MRFPAALLLLPRGAVVATLSAQNRDRSADPGPWRPWTMAAVASVRQQSGATPADVQAFTARLQELAEIRVRREIFESRRDAYAKDQAEFAEWQTPAKRAARRADWHKAAASMPKGAEFIAQMEKTDQQVEAMKKTQLAPGGEAENGVRQAEAEFKAADRAVQRLSPEGRAEPACYDNTASAIDARFRAKRGALPSCQGLVTPNRAYVDTTLPRTAPQLLVLNLYERCLRPQSIAHTKPGGCTTNRKVIDSMDWNAVRAWLNR